MRRPPAVDDPQGHADLATVVASAKDVEASAQNLVLAQRSAVTGTTRPRVAHRARRLVLVNSTRAVRFQDSTRANPSGPCA